jgi:hypothetical protein
LLSLEALRGNWSPEAEWRRFENEQGQTVTVSTTQRHNPLRQTVEYRIYRRWQDDGQARVETEGTVLRFVYPQEMIALLGYNGFTIRDAYGDWDRRPLAADSPRMIYVCQLVER